MTDQKPLTIATKIRGFDSLEQLSASEFALLEDMFMTRIQSRTGAASMTCRLEELSRLFRTVTKVEIDECRARIEASVKVLEDMSTFVRRYDGLQSNLLSDDRLALSLYVYKFLCEYHQFKDIPYREEPGRYLLMTQLDLRFKRLVTELRKELCVGFQHDMPFDLAKWSKRYIENYAQHVVVDILAPQRSNKKKPANQSPRKPVKGEINEQDYDF